MYYTMSIRGQQYNRQPEDEDGLEDGVVNSPNQFGLKFEREKGP
jgi:hypothetical protein